MTKKLLKLSLVFVGSWLLSILVRLLLSYWSDRESESTSMFFINTLILAIGPTISYYIGNYISKYTKKHK